MLSLFINFQVTVYMYVCEKLESRAIVILYIVHVQYSLKFSRLKFFLRISRVATKNSPT